MGAQGEALAAKTREAAAQLIAAIDACPDERWSARTEAEGWSVGVAAHHAAASFVPTSQFVGAIASGAAPPPLTMEMVNEGNAQHAQQFASCTRAETVDLARKASAEAATLLGGLSDEQLARTATLPLFGNQTLSAAQVAEFLVVGHTLHHTQSIKATV